MDILFTIIVVVIACAVFFWLADFFGLDPQPKKIVRAVIAAFGIFYLLGALLGKFPLIHFG